MPATVTHLLDGLPTGRDVLSAAELLTHGVDARQTGRLVRAGHLTALTRGWYAVRPPTSPADRHLLCARAHELAYAGSAVPSHYTALLRLGLPLYRADLQTVHLTRTSAGVVRRRPGLMVHAPVPGALVPAGRPRGGQIRPALAIVQTGIVCGPMDALIAADAAWHRGLVDRAALDAAVALVHRHPRSHLIGPFLSLADPRAESPGETRLRHAFHLMTLPVVSQAEIVGEERQARVDFMLRDHPVVVEFDGMVKYQERDGDGRPGWQVLAAEKRREDWLRGLGFEVERVVWSELDQPRALATRMGRAIQRSRLRAAPQAWRDALQAAARRHTTGR